MNFTKEYNTSPLAYCHRIAVRIAGRLWWFYSLVFVGVLYGVAVDWRWAFTALIVLFIIYPMIMNVIILRYATRLTFARRATANQIAFDKDDSIRIFRVDHPEQEDADVETQVIEVDHSAIISAEFKRYSIIINLGEGLSDFIIVPRRALSEIQLNILAKKNLVYTDK